MNKSHEPKTKPERKDRSIYRSRMIHADRLQAKAEIADAMDFPNYSAEELDFMLSAWAGTIATEQGRSPEASF